MDVFWNDPFNCNNNCFNVNLYLIDLVDNLVEKYGVGNTSTRKCKSCSYEQVICSSGVHVSDNGAVKVYADEDTFHCPTCDKDDPFEVSNAYEKG
jgi:hypothetical protein